MVIEGKKLLVLVFFVLLMLIGQRLEFGLAKFIPPSLGSRNTQLLTRLYTTTKQSEGNKMGKTEEPPKTFYDFRARDILAQSELDFNQFRNKVVIVVNAASYCGLTKSNYSGLSELLDRYYEKGLRVLLFPCNQFANQERESPDKIKQFVEAYDQRFVIAEKVNVNGSDAHPLWVWLKDHCGGFLFDSIKWNFTKVFPCFVN